MYCPRCGQQQVSDSVRFCSRCGLRLELVTGLLYNESRPETAEAPPYESGPSEKRRGVRQGAKLMFISAAVTPIAFGLSIAADSPGPLLLPVTIFFIGLVWLLYFRLFGEDTAPAPARPRQVSPPPQRVSLPQPQATPLTGAAPRRVDTADMAQPPTVTDHTTKLFEED